MLILKNILSVTIEKKEKVEKHFFLLLVLYISTILIGCLRDDKIVEYNGTDDDGVELIFTANMTSNLLTKALTESNENTLKTVDVLAFKYDPAGSTYLYHTYGEVIEVDNNQSKAKIKTKVKLTENNEKHEYVILGNLRKEVVEVDLKNYIGDPKKDVLEKITFDTFNSSADKYNRNWGNGYDNEVRYLPMWGENGKGYSIETENSIPTIDTLDILRSVAKINIQFADTTVNNFELKNIVVYHAHQKGMAVPYKENLKDTTHLMVKNPSVPTSNTNPQEIWYPIANSQLSLINSIYVGEHKNITNDPDPIAHNERLCILVNGIYDEQGYFTGVDSTWYRIDFFYGGKEGVGDMLDVLRNHSYLFTVKRIAGKGYDTMDEAIVSEPINIETEILVWEDIEMEEVYYDGLHFYTVAPRTKEYNSDGAVNDAAFRLITNTKYRNITIEVVPKSDGNFLSSTPTLDSQTSIIYNGVEAIQEYVYVSLPDWPDHVGEAQQYKREIDIKIHFDDDYGYRKVTIPLTIIQTNGVDENHIEDAILLYIDKNTYSVYNREAYVLIKGNFRSLPIRTYINSPAKYLSDAVYKTLYPTDREYHTDGYTGYDNYSSIRIGLPSFGIHGFADKATLLSHFETIYLTTYPHQYEVEALVDIVENDYRSLGIIQSTSFRIHHLQLSTFDSNWPTFYPNGVESHKIPLAGGLWNISITGRWEQTRPILWALLDEQGTIIDSKLVNNPSTNITTQQIAFTIPAIPASNAGRKLEVYFSLTGSINDLEICSSIPAHGSWIYLPVIQED